MRIATIVATLLGTIAAAGAARAEVGLQIFGGSRTTGFAPQNDDGSPSDSPAAGSRADGQATRVSDKFSGMEYGATASLHPLPLVPVSFGIFAIQQHLKGNSDDVREFITGVVGGIDVQGWLDFGMLQPFARFDYDAYSKHQYVAEYSDQPYLSQDTTAVSTRTVLDGQLHGYHGALGLRVRSTPFIGAFVQADFGDESMEIEHSSVKQSGYSFADDTGGTTKIAMKSRSLSVGVDLGI